MSELAYTRRNFEALEAESRRLRAAIEKLRDDVERLHDLDDEDFDAGWVSQRLVARRLTEILDEEGES